ncbi:PREDICTED: uncharacterized protein LOC106119463 [Papilio xuthus]|uniref:Uncharacterized protein LOC106119463 n=1 Tax=Papilio xuthus TaxID=66420 RepID=A0AAJ6ZD48_PAPXU|nr:PREDICTED: uncharacterized protein LOC106119463 [Papilio xuthus]
MWIIICATILIFSSPQFICARVAPRDNANEPMFDSDSMLEQKSYGLHFENNPDTIKNKEQVDNSYEVEKKISDNAKQSCAIVVLSNIQNPNMHSLLRKYRYDSNGVLIPSSVKYFVKLPKGAQSSTVLVPLHDKAFSPLGGFVRYYKEVPPIPQSW